MSKQAVVLLRGGLDVVTPDISVKPGTARAMVNFEVSIEGGYRRIGGYERFDGHPSPSLAEFMVLRLVAAPTSGANGDTVTGVTSGATGVICDIDAKEVAVTKIVGVFVVGETLNISGIPIGVISSLMTNNLESKHQAELRQKAQEIYRDDIHAVPGSGPVSVASLGSTVYAWRANADGDDFRMFESTPAGWERIGLGSEVYFDTGTVEIKEGQLIANTPSVGTAIVTRVVLQSGDWGAGTAKGKLVVKSNIGGWLPGNTLTADGVASAIVRSACVGIKLLPGGRVVTTKGIVGGSQVSGQRLFGCDGVNRGFEFDGEIYVPIDTGMVVDKPERVAVFKNHLFFSFGKSLQHSGIGTQYSWSVILGAAELSASGTITDLNVKVGDNLSGSMIVYTDQGPDVLYGNSSADWQLQTFNTGVKAVANTSQNLGAAYALCEHGVIEFATSQNFGNFESSTLTANIQPIIEMHRGRAVASATHKGKSQYRIFYSDGFGLYLTIANGKYLGCGTIALPQTIYSACEGIDSLGNQVVFIGAMSSGQVYQLDAGPSFDGSVIQSNLVLAFNDLGNSRLRKKFRRAVFDVTDIVHSQFAVSYILDYGDTSRVGLSESATYTRNSDLYQWDTADMNWDAFTWDGVPKGPTVASINGRGVNVAIRVNNALKTLEPFTINSVTIEFEALRQSRS